MDLEKNTDLNLQFSKRGGLLPVVVQEDSTGEILMLGYINEEAFSETIKTGMATFWSTSRKELWTKGKTSGDYLELKTILVDCDQDAVIYKVVKKGAGACHTKNSSGVSRSSCFYREYKFENSRLNFLEGEE